MSAPCIWTNDAPPPQSDDWLGMTKASPRDSLEVAVERSLDPGRFIEEREEWSFVTLLEGAAQPIAALVESDAVRAVRLYEVFLAGCYEKAEEGQWEWLFGHFVQSLWCDWLRARQAAGADVDETARRLLTRMEDDPYGFAYGVATEAVKVMSPAQLAAFERGIHEWFVELAGDTTLQARVEDPERGRGWRDELLRTVHAQRGDVQAYIAVCEDFGLTPEDCLVVARMFMTRDEPATALEWVDRGLTTSAKQRVRSVVAADFIKLRRGLLVRLGRRDDAIAGAWGDYRKWVCHFYYSELMQIVPEAERDRWHGEAMAVADERASLGSALILWLETTEYGRLVERVSRASDAELKRLGHGIGDRVAAYLDRPHPALAARVYHALGMRIVDAGKSRYYDAAFQNFADARRCYLAVGLVAHWDALVLAVRSEHSRKTGFMKGFDRVVAEGIAEAAAPFLERARARWFVEGPR
jgi:hypothetical protein